MMLFNRPDIRIHYTGALKGMIKTTPGANNYYGSLLEPDNEACKDSWIKEPIQNEAGLGSILHNHPDPLEEHFILVNNSIEVCPDGDLMLILVKEKRVIRTPVSSKVMSDSSPVWRRMMDKTSPLSSIVKDGYTGYNNTSNSNHNNNYERTWDTLTLEEDNQLAICILLHALHNRQELVPATVQPDQLFNISIICDKYDCSEALLAIQDVLRNDRLLSMWEKHWRGQLVELGWEGWLLIADVFGLEGFQDVAWRTSQDLSITGEPVEDWSIGMTGDDNTPRKLGRRDGKYLSYLPGRVIDWILNVREFQLEFIINEHQAIQDFLFSHGPPTPLIRCLADSLELFTKQYSASDIILDWRQTISPYNRGKSKYCGHNTCCDEKLRLKLRKWVKEKEADDANRYKGSVIELLHALQDIYSTHNVSECIANGSSVSNEKPCLAPVLVMRPSGDFMDLLKRLSPCYTEAKG